jgi:hypothetical protein
VKVSPRIRLTDFRDFFGVEVSMMTGASKDGTWQKLARAIAALWQGPLPRRPETRDPHEIDKFYVQRYAPRKTRRSSTSHSRETA